MPATVSTLAKTAGCCPVRGLQVRGQRAARQRRAAREPDRSAVVQHGAASQAPVAAEAAPGAAQGFPSWRSSHGRLCRTGRVNWTLLWPCPMESHCDFQILRWRQRFHGQPPRSGAAAPRSLTSKTLSAYQAVRFCVCGVSTLAAWQAASILVLVVPVLSRAKAAPCHLLRGQCHAQGVATVLFKHDFGAAAVGEVAMPKASRSPRRPAANLLQV